MSETRILAAQFGAAVGIKGEVRVSCYLEDPQTLLNATLTDKAGKFYKLTTLRPQGERIIVRVEGINDRTQAESLTRKDLYVEKSLLPKPDDDEYYHTDLIGLTAFAQTGEELGIVKAVLNFGAGDLLEIGDALYPFTNAFVPSVDISAGKIVINLPLEA